MQSKKNGIILRSIILVIGMFILTGSSMAQLKCSASIGATIMTQDNISSMSLSSADGTQFTLTNGVNSCFDISTNDLQPFLEGKEGKQKVSYSLNLQKSTSVSADVTNIRLNVLFKGIVKEGTYLAASPYMISVNYN